MSSKWNFLKAFDTRPSASDPNSNQNWLQWITGSNYRSKRALDVAVQNFNLDAFGRLRVSNLKTIFDSKQIHDNQPLFWDVSTTGSGASATYNTNQASTTLAVTAGTTGSVTRQSKMRFNYQPGKSQLIVFTGLIAGSASGITAEIGQMDEKNGLFFRSKDGVLSVVRRTYTSGTAVDTAVDQDDWNLDTMDGNGPSGVTIDPSKTQIGFIDYEWLGVGRVRFGFYIDGNPIYCHELLNTNSLSLVYMSTPNLPLRFYLAADGTNAAGASLVQICSSVANEGGEDKLGILRHQDSGAIGTLSAGTTYALLGIRLKAGYIGTSILIENLSALATSVNDKAHWELIFNPTVAGTFTYTDQTNSAVQIAKGASTNTVTGGYEIDGGYFTDSLPTNQTTPNALRLGSTIAGVMDTIVLCARPITNNITVEGSFTWRELS